MANITLILGGARSGKSRRAEQLAKLSKNKVVYVATAEALDNEMSDRISHHQQSRPQHWSAVEEPILLADVIRDQSQYETCILVDCLTLWLTNCLTQRGLDFWQQQKQRLLAVLTELSTSNVNIIMVSNEVGHGIVPLGELSREFVDQAGWLHQELAQLADTVEFVMAGLPLTLKPQQAQL